MKTLEEQIQETHQLIFETELAINIRHADKIRELETALQNAQLEKRQEHSDKINPLRLILSDLLKAQTENLVASVGTKFSPYLGKIVTWSERVWSGYGYNTKYLRAVIAIYDPNGPDDLIVGKYETPPTGQPIAVILKKDGSKGKKFRKVRTLRGDNFKFEDPSLSFEEFTKLI